MTDDPAIIDTWQFTAFFWTMTLVVVLMFCALTWSLLFEKWPKNAKIWATFTTLPASAYFAWSMITYCSCYWK